MIALIVLGALVVYAAGFMATARVMAAVDRRAHMEPDEGLITLVAAGWPIFAPVCLVLLIGRLLYRLATRDAGIPRAERRRRQLAERQSEIADLERWHAAFDHREDG
ncbi:hypothetical protein DP939_02355 [Spongiactinospora rosea]|uniref:Uncharacterized protein n=1 Tax=Spongiactinospora rosea TaxID=2248750 RepID=A0A366M6X1_9ACTN|nr:hypothetical protein [Spongiactinospora rosea]RBQ21573.1 hypothetical protein DP939_02355 [Spongiactinospora rosea]